MPLFYIWAAQVKVAYQGGVPTRAQMLMAIKDGARAIAVRDTESDLQLAQSYQNRFNRAKIAMAGTRLTEPLGTTLADVRLLMPTDADTDAMSANLDNAITSALDELNNFADKFDAFLVQAAIELQRHVPFYQLRQVTSYLKDDQTVTNNGFYSRIALPTDARVQQVWYGRYYANLAEGVEVAQDDIVVSNGRLYQVVTGGVLGAYELGVGLLTTDGSEELLGDLSFAFYQGMQDVPARPLPWPSRQAMATGRIVGGPTYTLSDQQDEIWFYPALDATHRFDLEHAGVAQQFSSLDLVTFDQIAAKAAAHYIRGMFAQTEEQDARGAAAALAIYQRAIREAALDYQDRQAGSPVDVVPYDWSRRMTGCGLLTAGTTAYPNDFLARVNTTGDIELQSSASNMVIGLEVGGVARTSAIVLLTAGRAQGDRMVVSMDLPAVAGIVFGFYNGTASGTSLLPSAVFTSQQFATDGETLSAMFEFTFNGTAWTYVAWRSPA